MYTLITKRACFRPMKSIYLCHLLLNCSFGTCNTDICNVVLPESLDGIRCLSSESAQYNIGKEKTKMNTLLLRIFIKKNVTFLFYREIYIK